MMTDAEIALEWFQENVIKLENPKAISVSYTKEGRVSLMCYEENEFFYRIVLFWTDFMGNTGYQKLPEHTKYIPTKEVEEVVAQPKKPFWKFWR